MLFKNTERQLYAHVAKKARCQFTQFLHNQESCELHVGLAIGLITCSRQSMSVQCTFKLLLIQV